VKCRCQAACCTGYEGFDCNTLTACTSSHVTCYQGSPSGHVVTGCSCSCWNGYTDSMCGTEIDECSDVSCGNGYCTDYVGYYECTCLSGYEGAHCETEISSTQFPTETPTETPSDSPSTSPTPTPSNVPSQTPTEIPTFQTRSPTPYPSNSPTESPSDSPTGLPTTSPSDSPTSIPTHTPTGSPTSSPSDVPSSNPTSTPTGSPTSDCTATTGWSQARSDELCSTSHHAYGVGLCTNYDNPFYQNRLDFSLANELYSTCSSTCVYDYDTYNTASPTAFKWVGSCYNVQVGKWSCIDDEVSSKEEAHDRAASLCEPTEPCMDRVGWTPEVAEENCPAQQGYGGKDKGYGSAKVCNKLERRYDGFYDRTDVIYQGSFNASLANHMFWGCNAKCIYDVERVGVVYQWKGQDCWEMQTKWACITTHTEEHAWAMDYLSEEFCPIATPAPVTYPCVERELDWDEATASNICALEYMGDTDKSENADVCSGWEDYQYRLDHSLANRAFLTCDAWCVYDIYKRGYEGFIWSNLGQCWKPVTTGLCIGGNPSHREAITDYIDNTLCESATSEPTKSPTCRTQYEWSEALMDEHCSEADTAATYKHYSSIGRAAVPCTGFEAREADLLKSMAMKLYVDCSSWCVYDFSSGAGEAWKWNNGAKCWDLKMWGSCHWNYQEGRNNTDWLDAMDAVMLTCRFEPTLAPTGCMPPYTWNEERAAEVCPSIQTADKSFGVVVCTDANSASRQLELEDSLANRFFTKCAAWCVYDYDTIIDNVLQETSNYGGFIWRNNDRCWEWVTSHLCFVGSIDEFVEVSERAEELCEI